MFLNENESPPFDALRYVTGECDYGGRVTDDKDRRLLSTLVANCYHPALLETDDYKLSSSGMYKSDWTGDATRTDMLAFLDTLPILPQPEAFGLHSNADIAKDQNDTVTLFASLLIAGGAGSGGAGASSDVEPRVSGVVKQCMEMLPPNFDIEAAGLKFPVRSDESMNTVRFRSRQVHCLPFSPALGGSDVSAEQFKTKQEASKTQKTSNIPL